MGVCVDQYTHPMPMSGSQPSRERNPVAHTERLILRHLTSEDAGFMLDLLNQPSFHRFIGDRGVRTIEQARQYLVRGPISSYERHGYGLYLVELRRSSAAIGICGLVRRDTLEHADLGFALLPEYWSRGLAYEAAVAVLTLARDELEIDRLLAITSLDNERSIELLGKLGFELEGKVQLPGDAAEVNLFAYRLPT